MDGSISPTSADLSTVIDLAALHTFLAIDQALSGCMAGTTITTTLLTWYCGTCLWFSQIMSLCPSFIVFILSISFGLLRLVITADCALWVSTLFAQINTCSLVTAVLIVQLW